MEELRKDAIKMIESRIEGFEADLELPDYVALMPSAIIDFAHLLGILSIDDYFRLKNELDKAKKARKEKVR